MKIHFRHYGLVFLVYLAIAILVTFPLIYKMSTHLYGLPGDSYGTLWSFWWNRVHAIDWVAPAQPTLLALAKVFSFLFREVTTYNLILLLGYPMAGLAVYLIVDHFTNDRSASFLSGLIYMLGPYHVYQSYIHLSLAMIAWLPIYFYALLLWLKDPRPLRAVASGFLLAVVILDNYYYGYLAILLTVFFVIGLLIQIARGKLSFWTALGQGLIALSVAVLLVAPFIIPSFYSGGVANFSRPLREVFVFRAQWWDFFIPPITHPLVGSLIRSVTQYELSGSNYFERTLYLGYMPLLLAIVGAWRNRRSWFTYLLIALFVTSLILATAPAPLAALLHGWFSFFRVYSRFGLLSLLAIAILSGLGIASISKGTRSILLHIAFTIFVLVDFYPLLPSPIIDVTSQKPYERVLSSLPRGEVIAYPLATADELRTNEYLSDSRRWNQPLFNAIDPNYHTEPFREALEKVDSPKTLGLLKKLNIRYIVIRKDIYKEGRLPQALTPYYDPGYPKYLSAWNDADIPTITADQVSLLYEDSQTALYAMR